MSDLLKISVIQSPVGHLTAGITSKGLALLAYATPSELELPNGLKAFTIEEHKTREHQNLADQLQHYFEGELQEFDVTLDFHGTDFQKKVWNALLDVPFGVTRSYKEQAIALGAVKAIRAVATANGANPIPIIVPCHRIIGSNQSLTGYAGGLDKKQYLLELESNQGRLF